MRNWIVTFLILSVIAYLVGYTRLTTAITYFSQYIFYIFATLFIATLGFIIAKKTSAALMWLFVFAAITAVSGILAFTSFAMALVDISQICFYIFLVLFIISIIMHVLRKRNDKV